MPELTHKQVMKKRYFKKNIVIGIFDSKMLNMSKTIQFHDTKLYHNGPLNVDNDALALIV